MCEISLFRCLQAWLCEIKDYGKDDVLVTLVGNKCDLEAKREVSTDDGELLAKVFLLFLTSSAAVLASVKISCHLLLASLFNCTF